MKIPKSLRRFLLRLLSATVEETKEVAIELVRKKWPATKPQDRLIVDGAVYVITEIADNYIRAKLPDSPRRVEILANPSDLRYDTAQNHWYLEGR